MAASDENPATGPQSSGPAGVLVDIIWHYPYLPDPTTNIPTATPNQDWITLWGEGLLPPTPATGPPTLNPPQPPTAQVAAVQANFAIYVKNLKAYAPLQYYELKSSINYAAGAYGKALDDNIDYVERELMDEAVTHRNWLIGAAAAVTAAAILL